MAIFQKSVIGIAIVLFIICLVIIGIMLRYSKNNTTWPPLIGSCPDFMIDLSGNGSMCSNVKNLGTCNNGKFGPDGHSIYDFSIAPYVGSNGLCEKSKWANSCGVVWDGINSGVSNPCDTSTST
jgi:hypothetical protein